MITRSAIAIPVYNHSRTIEEVLNGCSRLALPIFLIDDGSRPTLQESIQDPNLLQAIHEGKIILLTHEKNLGKGRAIQTAIKAALKLGVTHLITIDGDGQHLPSEIPKLLTQVERTPWNLVIGSRNLNQKNVPEVSRFGRRFSNFWVHFETGQKIEDSQSGLRIYPLFHLQMMRFFTSRYDFEIEVLIRLLWKGVQITEIPIDVIYQGGRKRISHFNKLRDNIRISLLNCVLVAVSLLKMRLSHGQMATALGLGVLVGTTPFFGLHTFIILALSLVLRLNAGVLWVGTQISIPPLAPILAFFSIQIGARLLPVPTTLQWNQFTLADAQTLFSQWLLGSLILGTALGFIGGSLCYLFLKFRQLPSKSKTWTGKMRGGRLGNGFLRLVVKYLGLPTAYFCLYFIVPYFYLFSPKGTRGSAEYWKVMRPDLGFFQRQWYVLKHYFNFGRVLLDRICQETATTVFFQTDSHGYEHISGPASKNKGVILLTAHVGAWDIATHHLYTHGAKNPFHAVRFKPEGGPTLAHSRPDQKVETLFTNEQAHPVLNLQQLLNSGMPVGMMGDRPSQNRYELVPFMDHLIAVDTSAFRMSAALNVPIVFTFGFRSAIYRYSFFAEPMREFQLLSAGSVPTKSKDQICLEWAADFAKTLERYAKQYSTQWFNFYSYFSSVPS